MIVAAGISEWAHKGHIYGECLSKSDKDLMYINIPKNASTWTKAVLLDSGWEYYNFHTDKFIKPALVVLRDPVDRWVSGIAEYFALYFPQFKLQDKETVELIFDRIVFDDHTEKQVKFMHGLDTEQCTFMLCNESYKHNFSNFIGSKFMLAHQHVSEHSPIRKHFKEVFQQLMLDEPKYTKRIQDYYAEDYKLIGQIQFYESR